MAVRRLNQPDTCQISKNMTLEGQWKNLHIDGLLSADTFPDSAVLLVVKWSVERFNEKYALEIFFFSSSQSSVETTDVFIPNGLCNDFYDADVRS